MIKLIVSDMDGSLLNDNNQLPPNFFEILHHLDKKNIKFIAASGRSFCTLYDNFFPHSDKISYIADNGACIAENNTITYKNTLNRELTKKIVKASENIPEIKLILCGTKGAHILYCPEVIKEVNKYYKNRFVVDDLSNVDDDIFKIGIFDPKGAAQNSYPILYNKFHGQVNIVVSAHVWVDIMNLGINKGSALSRIQKQYKILPEETMAFGDFYNDIEMLNNSYYSFVMENAHPDLKKHARFIAKSNNECGVTEAINEFVLKRIAG